MSSDESAPSLLLALPDACLLAVLQCCAANSQRSLFSAARAHSRLHQAAVLALHSVTATVNTQVKANDALLYLGKRGQHVNSVTLRGMEDGSPCILQLPPTLQLSSLELKWCKLLPKLSHHYRGLLDSAGIGSLKQLRLESCELVDPKPGEALAHLPTSLENLCIKDLTIYNGICYAQLPTDELKRLQQLTYLELRRVQLWRDGQTSIDLQPLQALTRLADLRLVLSPDIGTVGMLSGMSSLTHLEWANCKMDPAVLAGKTQVQHLDTCTWPLSGEGVAQLLSNLQQLQQLTYISLWNSLGTGYAHPPGAAYSVLTASSQLQHLEISRCTLPAAAWQHIFPSGKQLPQLQHLDISSVSSARLEGSRLVSCCPGLQSLCIRGLQKSAGLLAPLQGLSGLHTLHFNGFDEENLGALCRLTQLRHLSVGSPAPSLASVPAVLQLVQLTQLQQLTALEFWRLISHAWQHINLTGQVSCGWQPKLWLATAMCSPLDAAALPLAT
jgi:hypothetical protein